jgi:DNA-binding transcriptional MerR regulator
VSFQSNEPKVFGVTGASIFLGIAACTIKRHANSGLLPCSRDSSNKRLFKRADLEKFKRKHQVGNQCRGARR